MMKYNLFWIRVQKVMKIRKLTRASLADYTGVSPDCLRNLIYWNQIPDVIFACKISELLGVPVEYLVGGKDYVKRHAVIRRQLLFIEPLHNTYTA